jgi:hypothetical protein
MSAGSSQRASGTALFASGKLPAAAGSPSSTVGLLPVRGCSQFHGKKRKRNGRKERRFRKVAGSQALPRRKHKERRHQGNRDP